MTRNRTAFVTGGTGFIGRWLVPELLRAGVAVELLARRESIAGRFSLLERWRALADKHKVVLRVVPGDITEPELALDAKGVSSLLACDHLFHLAALYDLGADEAKIEAANEAGTRNLVALLASGKFGGTLHHISSIAVAGDYAGSFSESMFDEGQKFPHAYHRTKYAAEKLVRESGLTYKIYRPGAVVGDSVTGEIDRIDGPYFAFPAIQSLARVVPPWFPIPAPRTRARLNVVPVDYVARAIATIALGRSSERVFHIIDPRPPRITELTDLFLRAAGGPRLLRRFPMPLPPMLSQSTKLAAKLPSVQQVIERFAEEMGVPKGALGAVNGKVTFTQEHTEAALAGSAVACPPVRSYARTLWRYYEDHLDPQANRRLLYDRAFAGKTVLVTGASRGIGAATAELAAKHGARVVLVARSSDRLAEVADRIRTGGGEAHVYSVNLSELSAVDQLVEDVRRDLGGVDVLVNNAARSIRRPVMHSLDRFHDFERTMQLNYYSAVRLTLGLLPPMIERGGGSVINVLTMGVMSRGPYFAAYLATKSALDSFGDCLASEHDSDHIHVSAIYLELVETEMMAPTQEYQDRKDMRSPAQAAKMVLDGHVYKKRRVMSPFGYYVGIMNLMMPKLHARILNVLYEMFPAEGHEPKYRLERSLIEGWLGGAPF